MAEAEKNMVFAARLTQQGHKIASMDDLMELYEKSFSVQTIAAMGALPHPTIQKFAVITVAIVGASRRFLAQITRHQNEVKFMSASLQYSNYTGQADFAVPYSIMTAPAVVRELYLKSCHESMKCYWSILKDKYKEADSYTLYNVPKETDWGKYSHILTDLFMFPQIWGRTCALGKSYISTGNDNDIIKYIFVPQLKRLRRFLYRHIFIFSPRNHQIVPFGAHL